MNIWGWAIGSGCFVLCQGLLAEGPLTASSPDIANPPSVLSASTNLFVNEFRFKGNTVFSSQALAGVLTNWTHRVITFGELEDARRDLTLYYVKHGYVNSGAVLENQSLTNGIVTFRIIEGRLSEVRVKMADSWLNPNYFRHRLQQAAGPPLNMDRLQERLLLLRDNPNVASINAELSPGVAPGDGILDVQVKPASPWRVAFEARNDRPPSVGEVVLELQAADLDLTGHADPLTLRWGLMDAGNDNVEFSGLDDLGATYALPLTARDTTLQLAYNRNNYAVIQAPFNTLDIKSETETYAISLRQPLIHTPNRELALTLEGDRRHSFSSLLGQPFSFSTGSVNGAQTVSVLRFIQEYVDRNQNHVLALRSSLNFGLGVLGATIGPTHREDHFVSWLGQAQYVRRLGNTANQLVLSSSFQWSDSPLVSLEQLSIGGPNSVRGYEVNQLVRDMGWIGTAELRVPVLFNRTGEATLQLAPFFDAGKGWNVNTPTPRPDDITSAGIGLLIDPWKRFSAQVYWGYAFRDLNEGRHNLQDLGLSFRMHFTVF